MSRTKCLVLHPEISLQERSIAPTRRKLALITCREEHLPCFLAAWDDYDFCDHFPFQLAMSATAPDASRTTVVEC